MGRKKKNPELGHVGTIEVPNRSKFKIYFS